MTSDTHPDGVVFITGVSSGIGHALAHHYLEAGLSERREIGLVVSFERETPTDHVHGDTGTTGKCERNERGTDVSAGDSPLIA